MFSGYYNELGESEFAGKSKAGQFIETGFKAVFPVFSMANIPIIGKVFSGLFKKATHMESCMKGWGHSGSNFIAFVGGGPTLIPIDINKLVESAGFRYKIAHDVLKNAVISLLDRGRRQSRANEIFESLARQYNDQMDLFMATCATDPRGRAETGATAEQAAMVSQVWSSIRNQAAQEEYNETVGKIDDVYSQLVSSMQQIQEKGIVQVQALKRAQQRGEVSPTQATYRYTKSGVPLVTLGCHNCRGGKYV